MASTTSFQIKLLLVLTCMVSLSIVESFEPFSGHPILRFSPDQAYKQKFLLQYWKDCHDAWLRTGGCLPDIFKVLHGGGIGGLPGGGGFPLGPPADAPASDGGGGAAAPTAETSLDDEAAAAAAGGGGGLFPDIGSWLPGLGGLGIPGIGGGGISGIGGGIPGIGGGIPGIGGGLPGTGAGIPGIGGGGGPFNPVCCDALAGVQKSCPGVALNPLYGPLVSKHCAPH